MIALRPDWPGLYVGLPYADLGRTRAGIDCFGIVMMVYREIADIALPDYDQPDPNGHRPAIANVIAGATAAGDWIEVDQVQPLDVIIFRTGRLTRHVGLCIDRRSMLHVARDDCAKIERFDHSRWAALHEGQIRHRLLAETAG